MIDIRDVCKNYGDNKIIDSISLKVEEGQTLALLGTSGSGKTTLLKMINRLIAPTSGTIFFKGKNNADINPASLRKQIGYVIQQVGLFPHYTIRENIELVLKLEGWAEQEKRTRSSALLQLVGLEQDHSERYPHELSGGQQQRVGIARAMANNPPLILMDEPFGALDPITKQSLIAELRNKQLFKERTVVIVTHDVFEAITLADTICLLDAGSVQQIGSPKEMLFQPKNTFVKEFFDGQRFRLELRITTLKDVYPFMPSETQGVQSTMSVSATQNIWETLEGLEKNNLSEATVDHETLPAKSATPESLLQAFYHYKKKITA